MARRGVIAGLRRRSNCVIETLRLARALARVLESEGCVDNETGRWIPGREPYVWARPSRAQNGVVHSGVGVLDHYTGHLRLLSFKPVAQVNVPWWKAWTRVRFEGHYVEGDYPDTEALTRPPPSIDDVRGRL